MPKNKRGICVYCGKEDELTRDHVIPRSPFRVLDENMVADPAWRVSAVGVYRLWRDDGYAVGALLAGAVADLLGLRWAIGAVGLLPLASGAMVATVMTETLTTRWPAPGPVPP